jgi:hypothetical protein
MRHSYDHACLDDIFQTQLYRQSAVGSFMCVYIFGRIGGSMDSSLIFSPIGGDPIVWKHEAVVRA